VEVQGMGAVSQGGQLRAASRTGRRIAETVARELPGLIEAW
jgi:hypothetical protein